MLRDRGRLNLGGVRAARLFVLLAVACAAGVAATYWAGRDTAVGKRIDASAIIHGLTSATAPRLHHATSELLRTIDVTSLAVIGSGLVVLALLRRRPDVALAVLVVLTGANGTTQLLKPALGRAQFFGPDNSLGPPSFPSGHATVAMSLALAAVLASPAGVRLVTALAGAVYATAVGVALVALGWHYPSDVAGGYLVAGAWAALVAAPVAVLGARRRSRVRAARIDRGAATALVVLLSLGFTVAVAVAVSRRPELISYGRLHTLFFVSCAGLAALSLVLAAGTAALLGAPARRPRAATGR
jgi:membrane-associated phospholipid phosphatase